MEPTRRTDELGGVRSDAWLACRDEGFEAHLRALLERLPEALLVADAGGVIRWANAAATALTGRTVELRGTHFGALVSPDELTGIARARGLPEAEALERFHCVLLAKSGEEREVSVTASRSPDGGAAWRLYLLRDLRRQREMERQLLAQLADKQELEAFGRVASRVVHDLRNLNNLLTLTVKNFGVYLDNPAFRQDGLLTLEQVTGRIRDLIETLSASPRTSLHRRAATLGELAHSALDLLVRAGRREEVAATEVRGLDRPLPCEVDTGEMERVIFNLLLNAYEAAGSGGLVRLTGSERAAPEVVCLEIEDTGPGIPPGYLEHSLFRPFRSTKPQGLGLGLYHAKVVVEAHGGTIEVRNREDGPGARVRVILPRSDTGEPRESAPRERAYVAAQGAGH